MSRILHITTWDDWKSAQREGEYHAASLTTEGFQHCSRPEQVTRVANRLFRGQTGLLLLVIARERVRAEVRDEAPAEAPASAERFPHIYGALNLDAVEAVVDFAPGADGTFLLPNGLSE